jgi:hypothetical protein
MVADFFSKRGTLKKPRYQKKGFIGFFVFHLQTQSFS